MVKGAAERVLGAKKTASTYVSGGHGRLTVEFDRKPTVEEMQSLGRAANDKIAEGVEVLEFEMERAEAEGHFGDAIYDLFPLPTETGRQHILRIPDWNINCCNERHVENTLQIGKIRLGRTRYRNSKRELEIEFDLAD